MPQTASYRHRLGHNQDTIEHSFTAYSLDTEPDHQHVWKRRPLEQQPLAAENRFIWYCTSCTALKTLDSGIKP